MAVATDIQPFRIHVDEAELDSLRRRLAEVRWPDPEPAEVGWNRGVPLEYLRGLSDYWANRFEWREQEAALNTFPQFMTQIDGQPIHFLHVESAEPGALPLVLLHSWPGSVFEFTRMIGALADPAAHGGDAADAFHVVVPSIPGFGFSTPVREAGWATGRIARAVARLMADLGYDRYAVHGGDIGAGIAGSLTAVDPDHVTAVHVTTDARTAVTFASWSGDPAANPALSDADRAKVETLKARTADDEAYLKLQTSRPQTLAYGLTDSPVFQLAWIAEKFQAWTDASAAVPEEAVDRDQLLANVTLYWLTRSGATAAHSLYESMHAQEWSEPGPAPTGFAVFGAEPFVRTLLDPEGRIGHWTEIERGGHFPAMEQPELLTADIRAFLRPLR